MRTLYQNPYINIYLHETSHNTLEMQWLDFVPSKDFRACLTEVLHQARQIPNLRAWLPDNRLIRAIRPVDLEWCGTDIMVPMSEEVGVRRLAAVESQDAINRLGVNALLAVVIPNTQLTHRAFATIEEARTWATAPF